jgi:fluoride ion exporter CrcB/FEX
VRIALLIVFGALGTLARYGLQGLVQERAGLTFPYGTLVVNLDTEVTESNPTLPRLASIR